MSQCRGVAAFNGRYVEPVRSSVLGQERTQVNICFQALLDLACERVACLNLGQNLLTACIQNIRQHAVDRSTYLHSSLALPMGSRFDLSSHSRHSRNR